ncbi:glycosyl hydrolase family 65 protein [Streptomyces lutosisoli]|uniref:Glycosyl hydrolase family 65 protein n=1 Tax=Streptomyces lutosisoli TaxID=2665721 RepID=A0ABW2VTC8_9ACTN
MPLPELSEYGFAIRYRGHRGVQLRLDAEQLRISVLRPTGIRSTSPARTAPCPWRPGNPAPSPRRP